MSTESLRVAVVGLGKMGLLHASILNILPNVQLIAVCDKNALIQGFSKKLFKKIRIVNDLAKLADLSLDVVYVTTPISSHYPVVRTIYLQKLAPSLFVEKTLASSYEKARELCALAHRFGNTDMVGYMRRFSVTFRKAKDLLAQEAIGEPDSFRAYAYSSDFFTSPRDSKGSSSRGGVLRDLGCHAMDLALWFFGDFEVKSAKLEVPINGCSEDSAVFRIGNSNGLDGEFDISWRMKNYRMPEVGLSINGSKGRIDVNDDQLRLRSENGKSFTWYRHDLDDDVSFWLGGPEFLREDEYFVKSVAENHNAEPSFDTASKVDHIIDQLMHQVDVNEQ